DRGRTGRTLGPLSELTSFSEAYHRERNTQHDGEGGERRVNSQSKIEGGRKERVKTAMSRHDGQIHSHTHLHPNHIHTYTITTMRTHTHTHTHTHTQAYTHMK